jgi:hypothetical protein
MERDAVSCGRRSRWTPCGHHFPSEATHG